MWLRNSRQIWGAALLLTLLEMALLPGGMGHTDELSGAVAPFATTAHAATRAISRRALGVAALSGPARRSAPRAASHLSLARPTSSATASLTPSATASLTPSATATATSTSTATPTATATFTPTATATSTSMPCAGTATPTATPSGYAATILNDQPAGYWRLDERCPGVVHDSSGHGLDGMTSGGVTLGVPGAIQGDPDTAMSFDGRSGSIPLTTSVLLQPSQVTLEAWINATGVSAGQIVGAQLQATGDVSGGYSLAVINHELSFSIGKNTFLHPFTQFSSIDVDDGRWHHVVGVYDGSQVCVYVDGDTANQCKPVGYPGIIYQQALTVTIGATPLAPVQYFKGAIDEVAIYPRALTPQQILVHYRAGTSSPLPTVPPTASATPCASAGSLTDPYPSAVLAAHPLAYWRLGEACTGTIRDSGPAGLDGQTQGGVQAGVPGAITGDPNTAMRFDGQTGYIALGDPGHLRPRHVSVEAWVQTTQTTAATLVTKRGAGYGLEMSGGTADFFVYGQGGDQGPARYQTTSASTYDDGNWHHLVGTFDGAHVCLYVDGALAAPCTPTLTDAIVYQPDRVTIGEGAGCFCDYAAAALDEVAIYGRALTPAEVRLHDLIGRAGSPPTATPTPTVGATATPCPTSGTLSAPYPSAVLADAPQGYWRLDEACPGTVHDSSGQGHDGQTQGGVQAGVPGALAGDPDTAMAFDGRTGAAALGDAAALQPPRLSAEAWISTTTTQGGTILGTSAYGYGLSMTSAGLVSFGITDASSTTYAMTSPVALNDGRWHYLVGSYDGTHVCLYVDAAKAAPLCATAGRIYYEPGGVSIGSGPAGYFQGAIDEPALYAGALDASRILAHAGAGGVGARVTPRLRVFGNQPALTASRTQQIAVTNASATTPLTVTDIGISDAQSFTETDNCAGVVLPPLGQCSILVRFTPQAPGAVSATLAVSASGGSSPQDVLLTGVGTARHTWFATGPMLDARAGHTATLVTEVITEATPSFTSTRVLVAGGFGPTGVLSTTELFDPRTGTWAATGPLQTARVWHMATALLNGRVLVAGGQSACAPLCLSLASAELYDPATRIWTPTGSMHDGRFDGTMTRLDDGRVLVAGGFSNVTTDNSVGVTQPTSGTQLSSAELYDPATGTWTQTGSMLFARERHTATLLADGRVLVTGGLTCPITGRCYYMDKAELYDPATGTWTRTGDMTTPRSGHSATLLQDGTVLVAGGCGVIPCNQALASAEIYNPATATGTFTSTGSMPRARTGQRATLLPTGKVLIDGGENNSIVYSTALLYDPVKGMFHYTNHTTQRRLNDTATLLPDGQVLVAGGGGSCFTNPCDRVTSSAETYAAQFTVSPMSGTIDTPVTLSGADFQPNEPIDVRVDNPVTGTRIFTAQADKSGTFMLPNQPLPPDYKKYVGIKHWYAVGQQSGAIGVTTFCLQPSWQCPGTGPAPRIAHGGTGRAAPIAEPARAATGLPALLEAIVMRRRRN